jgi:GNAT superfamily N-acetyltransferase
MMEIRRYQEADCDQVYALHVQALQQTGAYLGAGPWDADLADIPGVYREHGGEFLVGTEEDGRIVAMGALRRTDADCAEIKRMRVQPDRQGRGYGTQMLLALEARARALSYRVLHLDTSTAQHTALALYRRHGYQETRRDQVRGLVRIFMEKRLA